ncbi:MAG: hypothetical protein Kow0069_01160 [Promethearchaeota archaeon]
MQPTISTTAYFEANTGLLVREVATVREEVAGDPDLWQESTFTKVLVDVDYAGEDPSEDQFDDGGLPEPYDPLRDPMFRAVLATAAVAAAVVAASILLIRRRARRQVYETLVASKSPKPVDQ